MGGSLCRPVPWSRLGNPLRDVFGMTLARPDFSVSSQTHTPRPAVVRGLEMGTPALCVSFLSCLPGMATDKLP